MTGVISAIAAILLAYPPMRVWTKSTSLERVLFDMVSEDYQPMLVQEGGLWIGCIFYRKYRRQLWEGVHNWN